MNLCKYAGKKRSNSSDFLQRDWIITFSQMILIIHSIWFMIWYCIRSYVIPVFKCAAPTHQPCMQPFVFPAVILELLLLVCLVWRGAVWPIIRCHGHFFEMLLAYHGIIANCTGDYNRPGCWMSCWGCSVIIFKLPASATIHWFGQSAWGFCGSNLYFDWNILVCSDLMW